MASFIGGSDSGFHDIADYRLYLDLHTDDVEFMSGAVSAQHLFDDAQGYPEYARVDMLPVEDEIWRLVQTAPALATFADFVRRFALRRFLAGSDLHCEYTLFVPVDGSFAPNGAYGAALDDPTAFVRSHVVPYAILPQQLEGRVFRLTNAHGGSFVVRDGRQVVVDETAHYPRAVNIVSSHVLDNGVMYVVDAPLVSRASPVV